MLLSSTRCASTTPRDSKDASRSNNPVRYCVGRYGRSETSAAARYDSNSEGEDAASRAKESAAFEAPMSLRMLEPALSEAVGLVMLVPVPEPVLVLMASEPQITRRMGNSLAQLLTRRAVLIAVGLAAVGGGRGWIFWIGAVDVRRRGGGGRCGIVDWGCAVSEGSGGEVVSLGKTGLGVSFAAGRPSELSCCPEAFAWEGGEGRIVGVGGPEGKGVVSPVVAAVPGWEVVDGSGAL